MPTSPINIEVNAFIPQDKVKAPLVGTFSGDNRGVGDAGTHRTQHAISVVPDATRDPPYRVTITRDVGETHKLDANGKVIATATAPVSELDPGKWRVDSDGSIVVDLAGNGKNPLIPGPRALVPGITYEMQLRLTPSADGTWAVSAKGSHDGFPGYEVIASVDGGTRSVVHGYDPRDHKRTPNSLFPIATDIDVDASKTVGPRGIMAAVGGAGYRVNPSPYADLSNQIADALEPIDMPLEDKLRIGPQLVRQVAEQGITRVGRVAETRDGTLTAAGVNPNNPEDVRRVTLEVASALTRDPERIVAEVAPGVRPQAPEGIEREPAPVRIA